MLMTGFYLFTISQIPDMYYAFEGEDINLDINTFYPITAQINEDDTAQCSSYTMDVKLMGVLPLKEVKVNILPETMLIPGGDAFGVKFYTEGLIVVGLGDIKTSEGEVNPSFDSGIRIRDIILSVNDKTIKDNEDLINTVLKCEGKSLKVSLLRRDVEFDIDVTPVKDVNDNKYKLGLWVRDSTAGIGTITYINPVTNKFAGLGHGICDVDTGDLMRLLKGNVLKAGINSIRKGEQGVPGELKGVFLESKPIGNLYKNTEEGIFGKTLPNYKHSNKPIPI
ncbi:MAG: stage sporulation protein, partial [Clostridia bacterium]|nr:stage sporulation protein [Clostridia bacterium]